MTLIIYVYYAKCHIFIIMLSAIMLSIALMNVIMLNVVAPMRSRLKSKFCSTTPSSDIIRQKCIKVTSQF
jgi:hypothetical protein